MKKYFYILGWLLCFGLTFSQTQTKKIRDDQSVTILKSIQEKLKKIKSAGIKFSLQTEKDNKTLSTIKGNVSVKGDKYKLILPSQHVYCDSVNVWSYLPDQNEVTISYYDSQDDENAINPIKLITNYHKYYRSAFIRETSEKGITIQIIDLYPLQAATFFKIRIIINKNKQEILKISISERDGYTYTYSFDSFIKNPTINDSVFVFNPSQYQGIEIIDMR